MKVKGWQRTNTDKVQKACEETQVQDFSGYSCRDLNEGPPNFPSDGDDKKDVTRGKLDINLDEQIDDAGCQTIDLEREHVERGVISCDRKPGAVWDVFRREDIPKLTEYVRVHREEFEKSNMVSNDFFGNHSLTYTYF